MIIYGKFNELVEGLIWNVLTQTIHLIISTDIEKSTIILRSNTMMKQGSKTSIKQRLIINFLLVSHIPMLIVAVVFYQTSVNEIVSQEEDSLQQFTERTAQGIEEWPGSQINETRLAAKKQRLQ